MAPVQNSTLAVISLIAGILGFTAVPFFGSIAAIITGHMAKKEIAESNGTLGGEGMAKAGQIMGYIGLALGLCFGCFFAFTFILPFLGIAATEFSQLLSGLLLF
jgi:hypothetical protein